jgi:hypothetical protein
MDDFNTYLLKSGHMRGQVGGHFGQAGQYFFLQHFVRTTVVLVGAGQVAGFFLQVVAFFFGHSNDSVTRLVVMLHIMMTISMKHTKMYKRVIESIIIYNAILFLRIRSRNFPRFAILI